MKRSLAVDVAVDVVEQWTMDLKAYLFIYLFIYTFVSFISLIYLSQNIQQQTIVYL